jgi:hypothetical protein
MPTSMTLMMTSELVPDNYKSSWIDSLGVPRSSSHTHSFSRDHHIRMTGMAISVEKLIFGFSCDIFLCIA